MNHSSAHSDNILIANSIWGICDAIYERERQSRLVKFFEHFELERQLLDQDATQSTNSTVQVANAIDRIKLNVLVEKDRIMASSSESSNAEILACAFRVMLMTECRTEESSFGSYMQYHWLGEETPKDFINHVYRQNTFRPSLEDHAVDVGNLRCHILSARAKVTITPTDKLSDHLCLIFGNNVKTLRVFSHRGFLEQSLERLASNNRDLDHSTSEALQLGCLPPKLLIETLRTMILLFPPLGNSWSESYLKDWVKREKLDEGLLKVPHRSVAPYVRIEPPKSLLELQEQYPYWAQRVYQLLKEVDHPTPITPWEKHVDHMKSPRNMYKCAMAALIVAAISGTLATVLAAVQVWISFCDWKKC